jgi:hypothetical protein
VKELQLDLGRAEPSRLCPAARVDAMTIPDIASLPRTTALETKIFQCRRLNVILPCNLTISIHQVRLKRDFQLFDSPQKMGRVLSGQVFAKITAA